jgi:hypothetical protein
VRGVWWFEQGRRYYLGVMQAHFTNVDPTLVEGGQFFIMVSAERNK